MLALFPEITACVKEGNVERLAETTGQYFASKANSGGVLDAFALASNVGIPVRLDFLDYVGAIAVSDSRGDIKASIAINRSAGREQQTFTICHLLGHFFLHIQPALEKGEWKNSGFKELYCPLQRYAMADGLSGMSAREFAIEDLADRYAGAVIMPAPSFKSALNLHTDMAKVAHMFGVTLETAIRRRDDLDGKVQGVLSPGNGARASNLLRHKSGEVGRSAEETQMMRDDASSRLLSDVNQPVRKLSRVVATHSYSDAANSEPKSPNIQKSELKGMDRIRELARKMDKFGDNSK